MLHDANGNSLETTGFGGITVLDLAQLATTVTFAGRFWDNDARLYNNRARWYEPESGRFLGEDPAQEGTNWYAYAGNDPVNYRDPSGLSQAGNPLNNLFGGYSGNLVSNIAIAHY